MPTVEQMADFERCKPLIRAKYPAGNIEELARECGCSVAKLQQRARLLKVKRDKEVATKSRLSALRRACQASPSGRRKRIVRGRGNQKIYELMDIEKALLAAGFEALAGLNGKIIQSLKGGAPYSNFLTIHEGWGL